MKSAGIELKKFADTVREQCPFVAFAIISELNEEGQVHSIENPELSVFICSGYPPWLALRQILTVLSTFNPELLCDITLLNRVDSESRIRAVNGKCLFIRKGCENHYHQFARNARLDYRIMKALQRRMGLIEND